MENKEKIIEHFITVGDLIKFIQENNIPLTAPIFTQRIKDNFFKKGNGWDKNCIFMKGASYKNMMNVNKEILNYEYKEYSWEKDFWKGLTPFTKKELETAKDQYYQIFTSVYFKEESEILFLNAYS